MEKWLKTLRTSETWWVLGLVVPCVFVCGLKVNTFLTDHERIELQTHKQESLERKQVDTDARHTKTEGDLAAAIKASKDEETAYRASIKQKFDEDERRIATSERLSEEFLRSLRKN